MLKGCSCRDDLERGEKSFKEKYERKLKVLHIQKVKKTLEQYGVRAMEIPRARIQPRSS